MCCRGRSPGSAAALCFGWVSVFGFRGIGGGRQPPFATEMPASKTGPAGPAARSRPRAEGCSSTSQACPLGCGLSLSSDWSVSIVRAAFFLKDELRPQGAAGRSFAPRRPATRVPQVRFVRSFASRSPQMPDKYGSEWNYSGPQPLGAEVRNSFPNLRALRRLQPEQ